MTTHEIACTDCDWQGNNDQLVYPLNLLDDDYADHGGNCPGCGANALDGTIVEFAEYRDMQVNSMLANEKVVGTAITRFAGQTAALILLALMGAMVALSIATPDHVSGKVSNDRPVMEAK